jgi:hypothetical protein
VTIHRVGRDDAALRAVAILGLDDCVDLCSVEGICASLRRAASFLCPTSPRQLIDSVMDALAPFKPDLERDDVSDALDVLVDMGDLLELSVHQDGARRRLLYLGPPSYVERGPGLFLLLGVRPNAGPIADEETLGATVTYESHTRSVVLDSLGAAEILAHAGLHRLTREQWAKAPRQEEAAAVVAQARLRLTSSSTQGQISGLTLIDPSTSVRYYKGRWREPITTDQGLFVCRRPQAYGAPIWCAVELAAGVPRAVLDLPVDSTVAPGWDEGRRLQAALDAERGNAQIVRVRPTGQPAGSFIFDFFGPLPSWAQRYLDLTGLPVTKSPGALFSQRVPRGAEADVRTFLSNSLWMLVNEEA